jgi:hypothetical protein
MMGESGVYPHHPPLSLAHTAQTQPARVTPHTTKHCIISEPHQGNVALAILLTVVTNVLGVAVIPLWLKATLTEGRGGVEQLQINFLDIFVKLLLSFFVPTVIGKLLRELVRFSFVHLHRGGAQVSPCCASHCCHPTCPLPHPPPPISTYHHQPQPHAPAPTTPFLPQSHPNPNQPKTGPPRKALRPGAQAGAVHRIKHQSGAADLADAQLGAGHHRQHAGESLLVIFESR